MITPLNIYGSVQKQKKIVASGRPVIAYRTFNGAFTFYYAHPAVTSPPAANVFGIFKRTSFRIDAGKSKRASFAG
jgi:hypothetical protein